METPAHLDLKRRALAWTLARHCTVAATEVPVPRSGFRADVAALRVGTDGLPGATFVMECKQSRADLLRDHHDEALAAQHLAELTERRDHLEQLIATHLPDLRRGDELFPEFESIDMRGVQHRTYRQVVTALATWQLRRLQGTKFARMLRYACADALYLVAPAGIVAPAELPAGWGWLAPAADTAADAPDGGLMLIRPPLRLTPTPEQRSRLYAAIARAGTRAVLRAAGVSTLATHAPVPEPEGA